MAWRIDEQVVRGEIDNRIRGRVVGRLWLIGREEPVELELDGNPWRDLAGHVLRFTNPEPVPSDHASIMPHQKGHVGDITASRKVKVPDCSIEEIREFYKAKQPFPWHWGNSLYLEWFSETNGRVVIESASYLLELGSEAAWTMDEADEAAQRTENERAMMGFFEELKSEEWKGEEAFDHGRHPLVEACADLAVAIHLEIKTEEWLPEGAHEEHPLREISFGVSNAAAKMAGALGMADRHDEWPPEPLIAGNVIVRLKKAVGSLRDALSGLESAEAEGLATAEWRQLTREKVEGFLAEARILLMQARAVLDEDEDDSGVF